MTLSQDILAELAEISPGSPVSRGPGRARRSDPPCAGQL